MSIRFIESYSNFELTDFYKCCESVLMEFEADNYLFQLRNHEEHGSIIIQLQSYSNVWDWFKKM